ncbi:hypothetical protein [Sphingomonas colocasiae]|uniref:Uncharacterized protein n=1 Tax=Sphingomonas colocasiae TaxID=1848973 RepID=A0ABS7PXM3_9SPHN|nr:hypothetical protein [Sphingomonas colocasiae]MBY8826100.1 hypothetical protein [Sphingomonas colocasiae]
MESRSGEEAVNVDPCRNACQDRCAEYGDPSCFEIWPHVRRNKIERGEADPGEWKPCTECLRDVGVEVIEPIDPAAVVRLLL